MLYDWSNQMSVFAHVFPLWSRVTRYFPEIHCLISTLLHYSFHQVYFFVGFASYIFPRHVCIASRYRLLLTQAFTFSFLTASEFFVRCQHDRQRLSHSGWQILRDHSIPLGTNLTSVLTCLSKQDPFLPGSQGSQPVEMTPCPGDDSSQG